MVWRCLLGRAPVVLGLVWLLACSSSHDEPCALRVRVSQDSDTFSRCLASPQVFVTQEEPAAGCGIVTSTVLARSDELSLSFGMSGDAFSRAGTHVGVARLSGHRVCGTAEWCQFSRNDCELEVLRSASVGERLIARLASPCLLPNVMPLDHDGSPPTLLSMEVDGIVTAEPVSDGSVCD